MTHSEEGFGRTVRKKCLVSEFIIIIIIIIIIIFPELTPAKLAGVRGEKKNNNNADSAAAAA
jgi:uncharacterized membrane protein